MDGVNEIIHGVTPPPDGYRGSTGAPSRPPSRTNNRSPLGRLADWTAATASVAQTSEDQFDADMASAIKASMQDSGMLPPQESGIVGQDPGPVKFGPATREEYGESWQMQHVGGPAAVESSAGIEPPSRRTRDPEVPAFLIRRTTGGEAGEKHKLAAMITILHEIPLARNVLLSLGTPAESYGHNSQWWNGQAIHSPETLRAMQSEDPFIDTSTDLIHELHRLMAILDDTQRSYASVRTLADSVMSSTLGKERAFYDALIDRCQADIKPLCSTAVMTTIMDDSIDGEQATFGIVEMEYPRDNYDQIRTLYEAWDHLLWVDALSWHSLADGNRMAMFTEMGEVIMAMLSSDGPHESIEIPEVWLPEKYLTSRKEEARKLQEHWVFTKKALYKYLHLEFQYNNWTHPQTNKIHKKKDILQALVQNLERQTQFLEARARFRVFAKSGFDDKAHPDPSSIELEFEEEDGKLWAQSQKLVHKYSLMLQDLERKLKSRLSAQLERWDDHADAARAGVGA